MFEAFWAWNIMKHARFDLWTGSDFNDQPHLPLLHRWSLPLAKILPTSPSSPNVQLELIRRFGLAVWKSGNSWFYELTNLNCIKTLKNRLLMPVTHSFSNSCIHSFIDTFISFHDIHVIHAIHAIHSFIHVHSFIHSFIHWFMFICKQLIRLPPSRRLQVHSLRTSNWRVSLREDLGSHHVFFFDELTAMFILMERGKDKNVRVAFHTLIRIFWSR